MQSSNLLPYILIKTRGELAAGLRGFRLDKTQTSLHETNLDRMQVANHNGADQTARMRRLVCAFVVCIQQSKFF